MEQPDPARVARLMRDMQAEIDELRALVNSEKARSRGVELIMGEIVAGTASIAEMLCRNGPIDRASCVNDLEIFAKLISKEKPTSAELLRFAAAQIRSIDAPRSAP